MRFAHKKWTPSADVVYSAHLQWVGWDLEMTVERVVGGSSRRPLLWPGCGLAAMTLGHFPLPSSSVLDSPPAPLSVGTVSLNTMLCSGTLWMTPWRAVPCCWISSSAPTPAPLCGIQHPDCHRDLNVTFFFFKFPHLDLFGTLKHWPVILAKNFMTDPEERASLALRRNDRNGVRARGLQPEVDYRFTSKASIWSTLLGQTLHINKKCLFYWLKTKGKDLLGMKLVC